MAVTRPDCAARVGRHAYAGRWSTASMLVRDAVIVLAAFGAYFGARALTHADADSALRHAGSVVGAERALGVFYEPTLQRYVRDHTHVVTLLNWIYVWGHWPVIIAVMVWLAIHHRRWFRITRNALFVSFGLGLFFFVWFPVAPPRLANLGFVDTVSLHSAAYHVLQPPNLVDKYAAMPSFHLGWDLLMGLALFMCARWRALRLLGLLMPLAMFSSIVLTANHYFLDGVVGVALVLVSLFIGLQIERRWGGSRVPAQPSPAELAST